MHMDNHRSNRVVAVWRGLLLAVVSACACAAAEDDLSVALPPGRTALADIGLYRVSWQSYGKEPVAMPDSWAGHFDPATGLVTHFDAAGTTLGSFTADADPAHAAAVRLDRVLPQVTSDRMAGDRASRLKRPWPMFLLGPAEVVAPLMDTTPPNRSAHWRAYLK